MMMKISNFDQKKVTKILSIVFLFIFLFAVNYSNRFLTDKNPDDKISIKTMKNDEPKSSVQWAYMNLTNSEINNQRFYHNTTVNIEGFLYEWTVGPPPSKQGIEGYKVALLMENFFLSIIT